MTPRCRCSICKLARALDRISRKCAVHERRVLADVWDRMAHAETDAEWRRLRAEGKWPG